MDQRDNQSRVLVCQLIQWKRTGSEGEVPIVALPHSECAQLAKCEIDYSMRGRIREQTVQDTNYSVVKACTHAPIAVPNPDHVWVTFPKAMERLKTVSTISLLSPSLSLSPSPSLSLSFSPYLLHPLSLSLSLSDSIRLII